MSFNIPNSATVFAGTKISETVSIRTRSDITAISTNTSMFTGNGTIVAFTPITAPYTSVYSGDTVVFVDRKRMTLAVDYTITGAIVTFLVAPRLNSGIKIVNVPSSTGIVSIGYSVSESGVTGMQGLANLINGAVQVYVPALTANTNIFLTAQQYTVNLGSGFLRVSSRVPGNYFTITSSIANDNCMVAYQMIEPA